MSAIWSIGTPRWCLVTYYHSVPVYGSGYRLVRDKTPHRVWGKPRIMYGFTLNGFNVNGAGFDTESSKPESSQNVVAIHGSLDKYLKLTKHL